MNDPTNLPPQEAAQPGGPATGKVLRDARLAAHIDLHKVCNDLRVSSQVIQALENGDYHLLPGDPYIRALLGSLGRYLNLDTQSLIAGYNREIGAAHTAPSIAPYKDRAHTYTAAHKQIFVIVFLGLFVVLFIFIGKLNRGDSETPKSGPNMNSAPAESLSIPQDTGLESHSLAPDSMQSTLIPPDKIVVDSVQTLPKVTPAIARPDTTKAKIAVAPAPAIPTPTAKESLQTPTAKAPVTRPASPPTPAATPTSTPVATPKKSSSDSSIQNVVIIKPLIDSVGVKVMRSGKEDFATLLRMGKQMQVSHSDTIIIAISKRKAVEVTMGGKSVIPGKKRFKIYGTTLKTF